MTQKFIEDIPSPWWIRTILVKIFRYLRKTKWGRYVIFEIKNRSHLGFTSKIHKKAVHDLRSLAVAQMNNASDDLIMHKFQDIANSFRDVMAEILEIAPKELHCTIKIFVENNKKDPREYEVFTLVRSEDEENYWHGRTLEYGSSHAHLVGENSSFAALLGISDRKNDWSSNAYSCFVANGLDKCKNYDSSGKNWDGHYTSTAVFPIRFKFSNEPLPQIVGFVTFDAKTSVFGKYNIFSYSEPTEYHNSINASSFYHVGGILADLLYPPLNVYTI